MKKILMTLVFFVACIISYAQAPQGFNYQAILRNSDGSVKVNETIALQITIVDEMGSPAYMEVHNTQSNELGLVNVVIGQGTTSGDFSMMNWSAGPYYIDITVNGENLGSSPLLSVPYALFAETGNEGPQGPQGEVGPQGPQGEPGDTKWTENSKGIAYMDGSVGIGISAGGMKLRVHQEASSSGIVLSHTHPSNAADNIIRFFEGTTEQASIITKGSGTSDGQPNALNIYTHVNQAPITLGTFTGEKIRIKDNGNVGIGTTNPLSNLHVNGLSSGNYGHLFTGGLS